MKIVFDTNVLLSAFLFRGFSAKVYDVCSVKFELFTSEWILAELKEKLIEKFGIPNEKASEIRSIIIAKSSIKLPTNKLPVICRDSDDNNILQLSDFINANYIITGDNDLLILKNYKNAIIITPRKFFEMFFAT